MSAYDSAPPTDVKIREEDGYPIETRREVNPSEVVKKMHGVGVIEVVIRIV